MSSPAPVIINEDNTRDSALWRRTTETNHMNAAGSRGSGKGNASPNATDRSKEVKVVTVGEATVGKTSITVRFVHNQFKDNTISTIGASFLTKTIYINGCWTKFNVWDTAGQEKYRSLAPLYYRGVDCAILVYDITSRESFEGIKNYWINELKHQCIGYGGLLMCIAGNKSDLESKRQVSVEEGQALAKEYGAQFFETSAKNDNNISDIFVALAMELPEEADRTYSTASSGSVYKVKVPERNNDCCRS